MLSFLFRIKQRQQEEQVRAKAHLKQRMDTMINLKKDIANNRVNRFQMYIIDIFFNNKGFSIPHSHQILF